MREDKRIICGMLADVLRATKDAGDVDLIIFSEEPQRCMEQAQVIYADSGSIFVNVTGLSGLEMIQRIVNDVIEDKRRRI